MIAPAPTVNATPRAEVSLRALVKRSALIGSLILGPFVLACWVMGHGDVAKGLVMGIVLGILNSLLLATRVDNIISGREDWRRLKAAIRANMVVRFTLLLACTALIMRTSDAHPLGLLVGLAFFMLLSSVICSYDVMRRWRAEGEASR